MAVPKFKVSSARRDKRRGSNWKLSAPSVAVCSKCGEPVAPHRACKACGTYNGRQVIAAKAELFSPSKSKRKTSVFLFFFVSQVITVHLYPVGRALNACPEAFPLACIQCVRYNRIYLPFTFYLR